MVVNRAKRCEDVADPRGYGHGRNEIAVLDDALQGESDGNVSRVGCGCSGAHGEGWKDGLRR